MADQPPPLLPGSLQKAYQIIAKAFAANSALTEKAVYDRLTMNKNLSSIQISNKIKESELDKLSKYFNENKLPGFISSFSSMKRIYSKGITASRLLGSVKEVSEETSSSAPLASIYRLKGQNGIEATYDNELAGQYGWREVMFNAANERIPYPNLQEKKPVNGMNVRLTIDSAMQNVVEESLAEGIHQFGAKNATAVLMDVNTGRIYAMAGVSADDYHEDLGIVRVKSNIPVSFLFEPGSTMKPFTALIALDHNLIKPKESFSSGTRRIGRRTIRDTHDYGTVSAREIIAFSSNVGITEIGDRVGKKRLYDKLIQLGFGQKTGMNLFGESSGIFHKLENWDGYSLHSITFGYAISTTAVQLAAAYAVIANGGNYVTPYIVNSYTDETGKVIEKFEPKIVRKVVSKAAADTMKSYLQAVVEEGTAKHIKLNYVTMAGKTGTAVKKTEGQPGYASGKYTGNFAGFFPVENPQMVLVVVYDEPDFDVRYGGLCAAPTFQRIVEKILFLPNCTILPNNKQMIQNTILSPNLIGMRISEAERLLRQNGLTYKLELHEDSTIITDQFPKPNVSLDKTHPISLVTGKPNNEENKIKTGLMPNLVGMTLRKAQQVSAHNNIKLKINGIGTVHSQSIIAGTKITPGSTCTVSATM
ncbi:MAG: penicillin-binding transpeptidase domain-containing protein [Candidatus Cloacimonadaceae bacterium]